MTFTYIHLQDMGEIFQQQVLLDGYLPGYSIETRDYTEAQMNDFRFFGDTFLAGGYLEAVHPQSLTTLGALIGDIAYDDYRLMLMVDEEGLLKELPPNVHATILYGGGIVVGPAYMLCTRRDNEGAEVVVSFPELPDGVLSTALEQKIRALMELMNQEPNND